MSHGREIKPSLKPITLDVKCTKDLQSSSHPQIDTQSGTAKTAIYFRGNRDSAWLYPSPGLECTVFLIGRAKVGMQTKIATTTIKREQPFRPTC
jgi:hypothetical protein